MAQKQRHLILFFVFSFIWTWAFYFAIILGGLSPYAGTGMVLLICGGCSPTFVGVILVLTTNTTQEKLEYFRRVWQVRRIGGRWWALIVLLFPAVFAVSVLIGLLAGAPWPEAANLKAILQNPVSFIPLILLSFMSGPFSEELGWRGYALGPLINRFGFTRASVLLGTVWAVWHLPLYFMPETWHGQMGFGFSGFWMFLLLSVGLTMIMSFVFVHTKESILAAMLLHLFSNFTSQLLLSKYGSTIEIARSVLIFAIGAGLSAAMTVQLKGADTGALLGKKRS